MDNQDAILAKTFEILETLKEAHVEQMGLQRVTHGMAAASYFRWQGDDAAADR